MSSLLTVENLSIDAENRRRLFRYHLEESKLVNDISFEIEPGQTLGMVGEEASGKLPLAFALVKLYKVSAGSIVFDGEDITKMSVRKFRPLRKQIQAVFSDGFGQLTPHHTLDKVFRKAIRIWEPKLTKVEMYDRIDRIMEVTGLPASHRHLIPFELDPADRQLAAIARAMIVEPKLMVFHEVTGGLDLTQQADVLNKIRDLQDEFNFSILLMTHDLAVADHMSDIIAVLHRGKILETGSPEKILKETEHDYTRRLVSSTTALN